MHKCFSLFWIFAIILSCKQKDNSVSIKKITKEGPTKFTREIVPDTVGCGWFFNDRHIKDTLTNESVVIKGVKFSGTLLASKKYQHRLWACRIPPFLKPNDTVLISGYVYWTYSFEQPPGYPTLITKIVY